MKKAKNITLQWVWCFSSVCWELWMSLYWHIAIYTFHNAQEHFHILFSGGCETYKIGKCITILELKLGWNVRYQLHRNQSTMKDIVRTSIIKYMWTWRDHAHIGPWLALECMYKGVYMLIYYTTIVSMHDSSATLILFLEHLYNHSLDQWTIGIANVNASINA